MDHQYLKNIKPGIKVTVQTSQNRLSTGLVDEIAARGEFNEMGIMVRLKNGDVGRVKKILLNEEQQNNKLASELNKLLDTGETFHLECKSEAFWSLTLSSQELKEPKSFEVREYGTKASKVIIAKSVAAFLNSQGGNLLIGVKENKEKSSLEVVGLEQDMKKLREGGLDSYRRTLIDEIFRAFFPPKIYNHLNSYIDIDFVSIDSKTICWIKVKKSDSKVFLKINDKEIFIIRVDTQNRSIEGEKLVDYCITKWGAKLS